MNESEREEVAQEVWTNWREEKMKTKVTAAR